MSSRLPASVIASALIRRAETEGGFGAVLHKGDATAGSILLILLEKGGAPSLLERLLRPDGSYAWQSPTGLEIKNPAEVPKFIARRRRFDPDLWVLELDIASRERFAADLNAFD
jgi:hypothetical protein